MPVHSRELLTQLINRLPELEWKINSIGSAFSSYSLPRGLFKASEPSGSSCIAEIKADVHVLSKQTNERSAIYLAERIQQKINVLVALCQIHSRKNNIEEKVSFGVKMLSTRKQWIAGLEADVEVLEQQHQALINTLEHMTRTHNSGAILQVKAEIGTLEKRLTLAKETLSRAIS